MYCYVLRPLVLAALRQIFSLVNQVIYPWVQCELPEKRELIMWRDLRIVEFIYWYDNSNNAESTENIHRPVAVDHSCLWKLLPLEGQHAHTNTVSRRAAKLQIPLRAEHTEDQWATHRLAVCLMKIFSAHRFLMFLH